jgi:hypothetical protein
MSEPYDHASGLALVEGLAGAVRMELGDDVEVCPGHQSPDQAEPLNRAFRALVRHALEHLVGPGCDLPAGVTRVLLRAARGRLEAGGLGESDLRTLPEFEPGSPDDWLVFVLLVPWHKVLFRLGSEDPGPA